MKAIDQELTKCTCKGIVSKLTKYKADPKKFWSVINEVWKGKEVSWNGFEGLRWPTGTTK